MIKFLNKSFFFIILILIISCFFVGLFNFHDKVLSLEKNKNIVNSNIVILTGGSNRIKEGLKVVNDIDKLSKTDFKILISGTGKGFTKSSLKKIYLLANKKDLKEHPTLYFYREGKKKFNIKNIYVPQKWRFDKEPRLTLDTKKDLLLLKKIFKELKYEKKFNTSFIKKILLKNPSLININRSIKQKRPKYLS